jgi:drug/metabolite transporter (DMT)-like permease
MTRRTLAVLALLGTATAWGATFALVKDVIAQIAPEPFIFWRFTFAGLLLLTFTIARGRFPRALFLPGVVLGALVFFGYWSQTHGLRLITASRSAFLTSLYVVIVPFLQWRTSGRPRLHVWIASILAVVGTAFMIGGDIDAPPGVGDALTLLCAGIFALHVVFSARWSTGDTAAGLAAVQVLFVGLAAAPLALFAAPTAWNTKIVLVIVFTAIVTTALAFAALMWGQAQVSATEAAVILSFEPVAAAITSVAFQGEPFTKAFVIGATLILGAMLLSQLRPNSAVSC